MFYRKRIYRRRGKRYVGSFRYLPMCVYSHRYRNAGGMVGTVGFMSGSNDKNNSVVKGRNVKGPYVNHGEDFVSLFPDYGVPTQQSSPDSPYFGGSEELVTLLSRYSKYKLLGVKMFLKNFKFLEITIRVKLSTVTDEERLNIQKYIETKYAGMQSLSPGTDYVVDYDKFDITYEYVNSCRLDYVYRNHTCTTDAKLIEGYVSYGVGDAPVKNKTLYNHSVLVQNYFPKTRCYLDSNLFFKNKYDNNFKNWLDAMGVMNYPNFMYARPSLGPDQYMLSDKNTATFTVVMYDMLVYYKFKFAGINNLDEQ